MNELSYNDEGTCEKRRYKQWSQAAIQAFTDQIEYDDKRKVYYCYRCACWHTSRERVKVDVPLLER